MHSATIDGVKYSAPKLPATEAIFLLPRLIQLFSQDTITLILATIFPAFFPEEAEKQDVKADVAVGIDEAMKRLMALLSSPQALAAILSHTAEQAISSDIGFEKICKLLMKGVTADRVQVTPQAWGQNEPVDGVHFDSHFAGRPYHLLAVCVWVIGLNFAQASSSAKT